MQPGMPGTKTYEEIVRILQAHYLPKPLVFAKHFRFHRRNQEEEEPIAQFVALLKKLTEYCEFGDVLNDTVRDKLVCDLRSEAMQKQLLTESSLALTKTMEIAVFTELTAKKAQQLSLSTQ
ncbi:hypothetical protein scyTo_0006802, partial [Scyliorhinus torazame]|nr:hypothetical protein [Scyliorhinus torazame]